MQNDHGGHLAVAVFLALAVLIVCAVVALLAGGSAALSLALGLPAAGTFVALVLNAGSSRSGSQSGQGTQDLPTEPPGSTPPE